MKLEEALNVLVCLEFKGIRRKCWEKGVYLKISGYEDELTIVNEEKTKCYNLLLADFKATDWEEYNPSPLLTDEEKQLLKLMCKSNSFEVAYVMLVSINRLLLIGKYALECEYSNSINDEWFKGLELDKRYTLKELGL